MDYVAQPTIEALLLETLQQQRDGFAWHVAQHESNVSICDKALRSADATQQLIQALMPAMTGGGWNDALIEYVRSFTANNNLILWILKAEVEHTAQESEDAK